MHGICCRHSLLCRLCVPAIRCSDTPTYRPPITALTRAHATDVVDVASVAEDKSGVEKGHSCTEAAATHQGQTDLYCC